jgi:hypothetical protein
MRACPLYAPLATRTRSLGKEDLMDPSNGNPAAGSSIPPNPGTISSFNPQPDIPGMGNPDATQVSGSTVPPNPGEISGFNPQPDIPG